MSREEIGSALSVPAIGGEEGVIMKKSIRDQNMPVGKLKRIQDDLPSPGELARSIQSIRITIVLNKSSVDYFKKQARRYHTKYQRMMREVLDRYVNRQAAF